MPKTKQVDQGRLEEQGWEKYSANYYWPKQNEHPHLHMEVSINNYTRVVTIVRLTYSTGGQGRNITMNFDQNIGFVLPPNRDLDQRWKDAIERLNRILIAEY